MGFTWSVQSHEGSFQHSQDAHGERDAIKAIVVYILVNAKNPRLSAVVFYIVMALYQTSNPT